MKNSSHSFCHSRNIASYLIEKNRASNCGVGERDHETTKILNTYGGFLKWWVSPTTIGFPTKNHHFEA